MTMEMIEPDIFRDIIDGGRTWFRSSQSTAGEKVTLSDGKWQLVVTVSHVTDEVASFHAPHLQGFRDHVAGVTGILERIHKWSCVVSEAKRMEIALQWQLPCDDADDEREIKREIRQARQARRVAEAELRAAPTWAPWCEPREYVVRDYIRSVTPGKFTREKTL